MESLESGSMALEADIQATKEKNKAEAVRSKNNG